MFTHFSESFSHRNLHDAGQIGHFQPHSEPTQLQVALFTRHFPLSWGRTRYINRIFRTSVDPNFCCAELEAQHFRLEKLRNRETFGTPTRALLDQFRYGPCSKPIERGRCWPSWSSVSTEVDPMKTSYLRRGQTAKLTSPGRSGAPALSNTFSKVFTSC